MQKKLQKLKIRAAPRRDRITILSSPPGGILAEILDGKRRQCPKCEGSDRFLATGRPNRNAENHQEIKAQLDAILTSNSTKKTER
jgi:hypothetical protein